MALGDPYSEQEKITMSNATEENVTLYADETSKIREHLSAVAQSVVSITDAVKSIAGVICDVRGSIEREMTSAKSGKLVTVPDWTGRTDRYRTWFRDTFQPLVEELIPADFQATIRSRVQNQVQEEAHRRATPTQKAHLGMSARSKAQNQETKRAQQKTAAADGRQSDEEFSTDALVARVKDSDSFRDVAQDIAAMARAYRQKTANVDMSKGDRDATDKLLRQALSDLMQARVNIGAVQTKTAAAKVTA